MKVIKNIIKGIITSAIGVATMIVTLLLIWAGTIDFVWEGIAGLAIGTILLLAPDTFVKKMGDVIKAVGLNRVGVAANEKEEKIDNPDKT